MTALVRTFDALGDPVRFAMFERLALGEATITDLADRHDMTLAGALKHVRKLEAAGLVRRSKRGRSVWCALKPHPLRQVSQWAQRHSAFWDAQLDSLSAHLQREAGKRR